MALVKLPAGQTGHAAFSEDGSRRHWLTRSWGDDPQADEPYALWLGMNPSRADHAHNDPSVTRMVAFTQRLAAWRALAIVNMFDFIATDPKGLSQPGVAPCSDTNLMTVLSFADNAKVIIMAFGSLPKPLRSTARHAVTLLRDRHADKLYCLGVNADGSGKHPLYLWRHTAFRLYTTTPDP